MSCEYCRGEQPLFGNEGLGDAWFVRIEALSWELAIDFSDGEDGMGELELEIEYCPMCGTKMADAAREYVLGEDE